MSDTPNPASAGAVPPSISRTDSSPDTQSRYVVERTGGGGGRAVYEVLDRRRHVNQRVICRTNLADAKMIVAALSR